MRMVFHLEDLDVTRPQFERAFAEVVAKTFFDELARGLRGSDQAYGGVGLQI